jgi:pyruvate formate lyase activating enzyme
MLRLGGLAKTSTLDYPSKLSAVIFARGCNFHCPYCHNPDLVPFEPKGPAAGEDLDLERVLSFLRKRIGLLEAVVVSGGEPTRQDPRLLAELLGAIKSMGYLVKLDTNGSNPALAASLAEAGLIDYLAVDVKSVPGRYPLELASTAEAAGVEAAVALALSGRVEAEFRTTCAAPFVSKTTIMEIAKILSGPVPLYLQPFRPGRTLAPGFGAGGRPQPSPADLKAWAEAASAFLPCRAR